MKLNEKEKIAVINLLKSMYEKNLEMLNNVDEDYWGKDEEARQKYFEYNENIKEMYEALETSNSGIETDNFSPDIDCLLWVVLLSILDNLGKDNPDK